MVYHPMVHQSGKNRHTLWKLDVKFSEENTLHCSVHLAPSRTTSNVLQTRRYTTRRYHGCRFLATECFEDLDTYVLR